MLACVCQPSDTGIFRRSPVPLGAPPLKIINRGAIPKPGRTLRLSTPVITSEPSAKNKQIGPTSGNEEKSETMCKEKESSLLSSDVQNRKKSGEVSKTTGLAQKVW